MDDILYEYHVCEYTYNRDVSSLTDIMSRNTIKDLRTRYYDKSVQLAVDLAAYLIVECDTLAAPFIFRHKSAKQMMKIPDALSEKLRYVNVFKHGIVLLGEGVIDLLHSNRIIRTATYIQSVLSVNSSLVIDEESYWFDEDGNKIYPGFKYLINYRAKAHNE